MYQYFPPNIYYAINTCMTQMSIFMEYGFYVWDPAHDATDIRQYIRPLPQPGHLECHHYWSGYSSCLLYTSYIYISLNRNIHEPLMTNYSSTIQLIQSICNWVKCSGMIRMRSWVVSYVYPMLIVSTVLSKYDIYRSLLLKLYAY